MILTWRNRSWSRQIAFESRICHMLNPTSLIYRADMKTEPTIWGVYAKQRRKRTSKAEHLVQCKQCKGSRYVSGCSDYSIADWPFLLCKHLFGVLLLAGVI